MDIQRVAEAIWPMVEAAINASVAEAAERMGHSVYAVPGVVDSVDDQVIEVRSRPGMGDPMYATCTDPATSRGDNTMVLFLPNGVRLQLGRIPS